MLRAHVHSVCLGLAPSKPEPSGTPARQPFTFPQPCSPFPAQFGTRVLWEEVGVWGVGGGEALWGIPWIHFSHLVMSRKCASLSGLTPPLSCARHRPVRVHDDPYVSSVFRVLHCRYLMAHLSATTWKWGCFIIHHNVSTTPPSILCDVVGRAHTLQASSALPARPQHRAPPVVVSARQAPTRSRDRRHAPYALLGCSGRPRD